MGKRSKRNKRKHQNLFQQLPAETVREFIEQSNAIESEFSREANEDAIDAFRFAVENSKTITKELILEVHRRLMWRLYPDIAGKFRDIGVMVGNRVCPPHYAIDGMLDNWLNDYSRLNKEEKIQEAHVAFEHIHPFVDGNGRTGRIIMNAQRVQAGLPILVIHTGDEQMAYYRWFKD